MPKKDNPQMTVSDIYPEDCLTTGQAARELQVAPGTLQNWRSQGTGPTFIKHRRNVYYLKSEIQAYKRKHFCMFNSTAEWKMSKEKGEV